MYLMGYSTEMILKAAYFKAIDFPLTKNITRADRNQEREKYEILGMYNKPGDHDLTGWARLLVAMRGALGVAYEPEFGRLLVEQAQRVHVHWRETLRYHSVPIYTRELQSARAAAVWFHKNRRQILR